MFNRPGPLDATYSMVVTEHLFIWNTTTGKIGSNCRYCKKSAREITTRTCPGFAEWREKNADFNKEDPDNALWLYNPTSRKLISTHRFGYDRTMRAVTTPCKYCRVEYGLVEDLKCKHHAELMKAASEELARAGERTAVRRAREEAEGDKVDEKPEKKESDK